MDRRGTKCFDKNGQELKEWSVFKYHNKYEGVIIFKDNEPYIKWSDETELQLLKDFWYAPMDQNYTEITGGAF